MRRTLGVLRLAALAVAGLVALGMPLPAEAAPSGPNVIAPVGTVQAVLVTPKPHGKSADHRSAPFRAKDPTALRTAKVQAQAQHSPPAPTTHVPASAYHFNAHICTAQPATDM